jgi:hypothetical protein
VEVSLVVIKGFSDEPMLLLTNAGKETEEILEIYLRRWKCEKVFQIFKTGISFRRCAGKEVCEFKECGSIITCGILFSECIFRQTA